MAKFWHEQAFVSDKRIALLMALLTLGENTDVTSQTSFVDSRQWIINANSFYKVTWEKPFHYTKKKMNLGVTHFCRHMNMYVLLFPVLAIHGGKIQSNTLGKEENLIYTARKTHGHFFPHNEKKKIK